MGKKNSNTPLLIGAAAIAAWYFWSRAQALNSLIFIPKGIGVQGGGVSLIVGIQNPTSAALQLNGLAGSLSINGSAVGNVTDFQPQLIQAGAETDIQLLILPNLFGIAAGVINEIDGKEGTGALQASLTGTANVNGIALPVNIPFS
jgi:Late embryogenesis abundant protein